MNSIAISTLVKPVIERNIEAIIKLIDLGLIIKNNAAKPIAIAKTSLCKVTEYDVSSGENETKLAPTAAKNGLKILLPMR